MAARQVSQNAPGTQAKSGPNAPLASLRVSRLKAAQTAFWGAWGNIVSDNVKMAAQEAATADLPKAIGASAKLVDSALDAVLPQASGPQARVQEAMRYAIMAGGKRLRPFLVLHSARLFGVDDSRSLRVGAAIEALHTYSLVHDDLP